MLPGLLTAVALTSLVLEHQGSRQQAQQLCTGLVALRRVASSQTRELNPCSLHWQMDSYLLYYQGSSICLCLKALKQGLVMLPYVKAIFVTLNSKLKAVYNLPITVKHGHAWECKDPLKIPHEHVAVEWLCNYKLEASSTSVISVFSRKSESFWKTGLSHWFARQ